MLVAFNHPLLFKHGYKAIIHLPYGGKLWRVQTLANWQEKLHWQNKLWQIDYESLIKRILKII